MNVRLGSTIFAVCRLIIGAAMNHGDSRAAIKITSIAELLSEVLLFAKAGVGDVWFRGRVNSDWRLSPHAYRVEHTFHEQECVSSFRLNAPARHEPTPEWEDWAGWLSLMQHYGLPTRLLDWTRSPLNAAFFACFDIHGKVSGSDAAIWALTPRYVNALTFNTPQILPLSNDNAQIRDFMLGAFENDNVPPSAYLGICAVTPQHRNTRMLVQQSVFTLHKNIIPLDKVPDFADTHVKFVIPSEKKQSLLEELELIGISASSLYPDLTYLSTDIISAAQRSVFHRYKVDETTLGMKAYWDMKRRIESAPTFLAKKGPAAPGA